MARLMSAGIFARRGPFKINPATKWDELISSLAPNGYLAIKEYSDECGPLLLLENYKDLELLSEKSELYIFIIPEYSGRHSCRVKREDEQPDQMSLLDLIQNGPEQISLLPLLRFSENKDN